MSGRELSYVVFVAGLLAIIVLLAVIIANGDRQKLTYTPAENCVYLSPYGTALDRPDPGKDDGGWWCTGR